MEYKYSNIFTWSSGKPVELNDGSIPVYGSNGIIGYSDKAKYNNKIILGRVGAYCGSVEYCPDDFNATDNTLITTCNEEYIDYKYAFYMLKVAELNKYAGGSAQPLITQSILKHLKCDIPDLEIQNKIASVLSTYDDLIEKNNHKIEILQDMAEELYKEWFVRFRFPGHEIAKFTDGIPDGWEKVRLKNVVQEVGCNVNPKDRNNFKYYVPIDCISSHSMVLSEVDSIDNAESSLISYKKGDILFGVMRPYFHKVVRAPFNGLTRKTCFVLNSIDEIKHYYAYMLLFQNETIAYATTISVGSTMPYVRWEDFSRMNCLLPDDKTLLKFNRIMKTYCRSLELLQEEINVLKQQRDLLLPRLMSGKLEVKVS